MQLHSLKRSNRPLVRLSAPQLLCLSDLPTHCAEEQRELIAEQDLLIQSALFGEQNGFNVDGEAADLLSDARRLSMMEEVEEEKKLLQVNSTARKCNLVVAVSHQDSSVLLFSCRFV